MKKIFFVFLFGFSFFVQAELQLHDFKIEPNSLFVDEEGSVLFSVHYESSQEKPKSIFLIEIDKTGEKIRYHWELKDDGFLGDLKAGDGLYSRTIQFKEKNPNVLHFLVSTSIDEEMAKRHADIKELNPTAILKADLEIKPRPSLIEIMSQIWKKIKSKR